ncbi:MAG: hypothetical protein LBQ52_08220 [Helicobacteraceae bacterium]|jgi:alpha-tubulin suppressor-like RCC1 family protein|nr:hypothetical protein [Helicobacteraceae bacterium]
MSLIFLRFSRFCATVFALIYLSACAISPAPINADKKEQTIIIEVAVGASHSIVIDDNNKVWTTGHNKYGQLALGDTYNRNVFTRVKGLNDINITKVAAGYFYTIALDDSGAVWASGHNNFGQLGLGDLEDRYEFVKVDDFSDSKIVSICAGVNHTIALDDNGLLWVAGDNFNGQAGILGSNYYTRFTRINSFETLKIVSFACGWDQTFAIDDANAVWATGHNYYYQLGLGDRNDRNSFIKIAELNDKNITKIVAGDYHSAALSVDDKIWACGANFTGQLGELDLNWRKTFSEIKSLDNRSIISLYVGAYHSFAIGAENDANHTLFATGNNSIGQLGLGDYAERAEWTQVAPICENYAAIAARDNHSIALCGDGSLFATGFNFHGQLGVGDERDRYRFTKVNFYTD